MAIDWTILDKIQSMLSSGFMDWLMPRITMLGNAGAIWIVIGAWIDYWQWNFEESGGKTKTVLA